MYIGIARLCCIVLSPYNFFRKREGGCGVGVVLRGGLKCESSTPPAK